MASQRGNALFLILIAVALFAALSYAVTQSGRGSGTIDRESSAIAAAQITQIGADMRLAVQRMTLTGTPGNAIIADPDGDGGAGGGTNNTYTDPCTAGTDCLFAAEGGGYTPPTMPRNAFLATAPSDLTGFGILHYFDGAHGFNGWLIDALSPGNSGSMTVPGIGTSAPEDIVQIYPLNKEVCSAINKGLGISGIPVSDGGTTLSVVANHDAGCIDLMGDGQVYWYYQVLLKIKIRVIPAQAGIHRDVAGTRPRMDSGLRQNDKD